LIAMCTLLFTSCVREKKSVLTDVDDNGGYASDLSRIELYNDDAISIADAAGFNYNRDFIGAEGCATVAVDTLLDPVNRTLIIRFNNCNGSDGRARKGAIIVKYTGKYADSGKVKTISFDNYWVNGTQMTGTIKYIRVDTTIVGNWYYKITVNDSLNMSQDPLKSQWVVWKGALVRKWVTGYTTLTRQDDVFSISGDGTLTRPNLHQFTCNIGTPLQFAIDCDYCESGVVNVSAYTGMRVLSYGLGDCDNLAQLNIGQQPYSLRMTK